jgi:hypothetical protein
LMPQKVAWLLIQVKRTSKFMAYGVLIIFYFVVITPIAILLRICGRDALHLKHHSANGTTWLVSDSRIGKCGREMF